MMSIISLALSVGLKIIEILIKKSADNEKSMHSFYEFVEKINSVYMASADMRKKAQARFKEVKSKPFKESV